MKFEDYKKKDNEKNFYYDMIIGELNRISISDSEDEVEYHMKNIVEVTLPKYKELAREAHTLFEEFNEQMGWNK